MVIGTNLLAFPLTERLVLLSCHMSALDLDGHSVRIISDAIKASAVVDRVGYFLFGATCHWRTIAIELNFEYVKLIGQRVFLCPSGSARPTFQALAIFQNENDFMSLGIAATWAFWSDILEILIALIALMCVARLVHLTRCAVKSEVNERNML